MRALVDAAAGTVEVFFMDGRVAMTALAPPPDPGDSAPMGRGGGIFVTAAGGACIASADVWGMRPPLVSHEDVLSARSPAGSSH